MRLETCTVACDLRPEVGLEAHAPVCYRDQVAALRAAADALAAAAQAFEQLRTETIEHGVSSDYSERYERLVEQRQAALAAYRAARGWEG